MVITVISTEEEAWHEDEKQKHRFNPVFNP